MKRSSEIDLHENNIDVFDQTVGEYFAALYAAFPVRIALETNPKELNDLDEGKLILPGLRAAKDKIDWDYDRIVDDITSENEISSEMSEKEKIYYKEIRNIKEGIPDLIAIRKRLEVLSIIRTETADWLHKSGYITVDKEKKGNWNTSIRWASQDDTLRDDRFVIYSGYAPHSLYEGARLTTKGLEVLRAVPSTVSNEDNKSVGGQLVDQMKDVAVDSRKAVVSNLVREAISIGVKIMAN